MVAQFVFPSGCIYPYMHYPHYEGHRRNMCHIPTARVFVNVSSPIWTLYKWVGIVFTFYMCFLATAEGSPFDHLNTSVSLSSSDAFNDLSEGNATSMVQGRGSSTNFSWKVIVVLVILAILGVSIVVTVILWCYRCLKRRREARERERHLARSAALATTTQASTQGHHMENEFAMELKTPIKVSSEEIDSERSLSSTNSGPTKRPSGGATVTISLLPHYEAGKPSASNPLSDTSVDKSTGDGIHHTATRPPSSSPLFSFATPGMTEVNRNESHSVFGLRRQSTAPDQNVQSTLLAVASPDNENRGQRPHSAQMLPAISSYHGRWNSLDGQQVSASPLDRYAQRQVLSDRKLFAGKQRIDELRNLLSSNIHSLQGCLLNAQNRSI